MAKKTLPVKNPGPWIEGSCADHGCDIQPPLGMGTNGGCRCDERKLHRFARWSKQRIAWLESIIKADLDSDI